MIKKKNIAAYTFGIILFHITSLICQDRDTYLDYINAEIGLPNNEVTAIARDNYGFMWIGTRGGLSRFDGYEYIEYTNDIKDDNSLVNNSIECLLTDGDQLWIGTKSGGLSRFDLLTETFTNYQYDSDDDSSISQNRVISIYADRKGRKWFATFDNGINLFDEQSNSFERFLKGQKLIRTIEDELGNVWVATNRGLAIFDELKKTFESISINGLPTSSIADIALKGNSLFIGTWEGYLIKFDIKTRSIVKVYDDKSIFQNKDQSLSLYRIYKDRNDQILLGTWGDGLYVLNKEETKFTKYDLTPPGELESVAYNVVLDIFENENGTIWLGTNNGGIVRIIKRTTRFDALSVSPPSAHLLKNLHVSAIFKDSNANLWLATKGKGAYIIKENSSIIEPIFIPFNNKLWRVVNAFLEDDEGHIWIGHAQGIHILNPDFTIKRYLSHQTSDKSSLSGPMITALFKDKAGNIWVGTQQNGLNRLLANEDHQYVFERYAVVPGKTGFFNNSRITCFAEERSGKIWVGTYGGLHLIDPSTNEIKNFIPDRNNKDGINSHIITSLNIDAENTLWIGTPNGLNRLQLGLEEFKFQSYTKDDGLPNAYIHAIVPDDIGQLWVSTNKGISNMIPEEMEFRNFDLSDGISSLSYSDDSYYKDANGVIYFGGSRGITSFQPKDIQVNKTVPQVCLTSILINDHFIKVGEVIHGRKILDRNVNETKKINLTYRDRVVAFKFTSLNYLASQNNRFKYMLEGYDKDWIYANSSRTATYTELPPGDYTFKVMGSNNANIWNEDPLTMEVFVSQPPWKSSYAKVIYALLTLSLLYVIRKFTIAQQMLRQDLAIAKMTNDKEAEMYEMKNNFFTTVSHEIRTPLTLIAGPLEEILENPKTDSVVRQKLSSVQMNTAHLLRLVSELLEFRKIENNQQQIKVIRGNFVRFCEELYLSFRAFAQSKNVTFEFINSTDNVELWYDKQKFEIILSNLLLNAFKHSVDGGQVTLILDNEHEDEVRIIVKDNGTGIPVDKQSLVFDRYYQVVNSDTANIAGSGLGLSLVKDLLALHDASITLKSEEGVGTEFTIRMLRGCAHFEPDQIVGNYTNTYHPDHYIMDHDAAVIEEMLAIQPDYSILIIEDNPQIRSFIASIFQSTYQVFEAENGQEGLKKAVEHLPDLIISDIMMPVMDGLSLCTAIKANTSTNHIPVILLTARTSNFYKIEGLSSGADDYITKPFHVSEIKARVKNQILIRQNLKERFQKIITLEPTEIEIANEDAIFLDKAFQILEEHIDDHMLGADLLAQELGMSQSTLYRKLKALTGSSISNFIRDTRLKVAAQYLKKSTSSIKEITFMTGFSDVKYFRKCFIQQFGVTPKDFRASSLAESGFSDVAVADD